MLAKFTTLVFSVALVAIVCMPIAVLAADPAPADAHAAEHAAEGHGEHGHEHIGHANAGDNLEKPEEFKSDLALFTFVVFLVLLAVLWKFAWGPIIQALERREEMVANHIAQAERNHEEAKRLLAQYEQKLAAAAGEVRELMEQARRDAEATKASILAEAKQAAEAERVRALRDIDSATDAAMESLAKKSADLAVELAGKIVQSQLTKDDHSRLINEAIAKFPANVASSN